MADINWAVIASLVGGGFAGAILTNLVAIYRARRQPVGRRMDFLPVFHQAGNPSQLSAKIAVTHNGNTTNFENLFLAEIQILNKGNADGVEFDLGATLGGGDQCIHVDFETPSRFHKVELLTGVTPQSPQRTIDFRLKPFNRRDVYWLRLYLVIPTNQKEPQSITLESPKPVNFVDMPTLRETLDATYPYLSIVAEIMPFPLKGVFRALSGQRKD